MSRKTVVSFKIDPEEKAWLQDLADEQGLTLSELCAACVQEIFVKVPEEEEDPTETAYWEPEAVGDGEPYAEEPFTEDSEDDAMDLPHLLPALDLPEPHLPVITHYLHTAAEANETTEADILARLLAAAMADYEPGRASFWTATIGNIDPTEILNLKSDSL